MHTLFEKVQSSRVTCLRAALFTEILARSAIENCYAWQNRVE